MIEKTIEQITYRLQQNKKNGKPGAIFFIGAGCSITSGIPGATEIVDYVIKNYDSNPDIKKFTIKPTYTELMECLEPWVEKPMILTPSCRL